MMLDISKEIVTDEAGTPVAVQIDYADWERIEERLRSSDPNESGSSFESTLAMTRDIWTAGDGLAYQRKIRSEWGRSGETNPDS